MGGEGAKGGRGQHCRRWREGPSASGGEGGSKTCGRDVAGGGAEAGKNADADGCGRKAGRARRSGRERGLTRCEGRVVEGGGWRGRHQEATRGCSSSRPSTAGEVRALGGATFTPLVNKF